MISVQSLQPSEEPFMLPSILIFLVHSLSHSSRKFFLIFLSSLNFNAPNPIYTSHWWQILTSLRALEQSKSTCTNATTTLLISTPHTLYPWLLLGTVLPIRGYVSTSTDIFDCYTRGGDAIGIQWVEAWDAVKHLAIHRTTPTSKN